MLDELEITVNITSENLTVILDGTVYGDIMDIDWGDNTTIQNIFNTHMEGGSIEAHHTYEQSGTYVIKVMGNFSFRRDSSCEQATKIKIPHTWEDIPPFFFNDSPILEEIHIPHTVTIIGSSFLRDTPVHRIYFETMNPPLLSDDLLENVGGADCKLYVPNIGNYLIAENYPSDISKYETIPLAETISTVYNELKDLLENKFQIDLSEDDDIGLISLINKVKTLTPCVKQDLTSYLQSTSDYTSGMYITLLNDSLRIHNTIITVNQKEFTESRYWQLTFDWKMSTGYDGGFTIGDVEDYCSLTQQTSAFAIQHGKGTNDGYYTSYGSLSLSERFTSYVPVRLTRTDNIYTVDINNGLITYTWSGNHTNQLGFRKWSNGYLYVKNLKLITY